MPQDSRVVNWAGRAGPPTRPVCSPPRRFLQHGAWNAGPVLGADRWRLATL